MQLHEQKLKSLIYYLSASFCYNVPKLCKYEASLSPRAQTEKDSKQGKRNLFFNSGSEEATVHITY